MPEPRRRESYISLLRALPATATRVYEQYPAFDQLDELVEMHCDAIVLDLDPDVEKTLELAAELGTRETAAVMVCSASKDATLLMRVMQAGVREFLSDPVHAASLREALERARGRRIPRRGRISEGKLLVFAGTKGGAGSSTIAANFAVALRKESSSKVAVVDLDLQLGEVALALGVSPPFSVADALRNAERLDSDFLSTLLVSHSSGVDILAAPEAYDSFRPAEGAPEKLLRILRRNYDFVVVDAGAIGGEILDVLIALADTLYVVTEMSIPSLRNARRMMSYVARRERGPRIQIVLNRFDSHEMAIHEENAIKALARPADWKVPNDYPSVRAAQNTGIPLALKDSPITRVLMRMAREASGKPVEPERTRRKLFRIFE